MKKQPSRMSTLAPPLGGGKCVIVMAALIFFVLAMVVPFSIQSDSDLSHDPYSNDEAPTTFSPTTLDPETMAPMTISPNTETMAPDVYTDSILPRNYDDDIISNSQDGSFANVSPFPPTRLPSLSPISYKPTNMQLAASSEPSKRPSKLPSMAPSRFLSLMPSQAPLDVQSHRPSHAPSNFWFVESTFVPGLLDHMEHGLVLSSGLTARILAKSGTRVVYHGGATSSQNFHGMPDFAATFADTRSSNPGGWVYVSNSEMETAGAGGVGALTFDSQGNVINYERLLSGTTKNCGGGKSPWGSWISCEEAGSSGVLYQVDPTGKQDPQVLTLGSEGGNWESFAANIADPSKPQFFVTEDAPKGALQRFSPHNFTWDTPEEAWNMLHGPGTIEYLMLQPNAAKNGGTFSWGTNRWNARNNAGRTYPNSEGIDVHESKLYFVCKKIKSMFVLDLVTQAYTNQSTVSGLFDGGPDQLQRILAEGAEDFLFFTEEGGKDAGIHGRDATGLFFTLLESPEYDDETTGLAFSPNVKHMYVAYQKNGLLFDVTREDGLPFHAKSLNVKYHASP